MVSRSPTIKVSLIGDIADLQSAFRNAERDAEGFSDRMTRVGGQLTRRVTLPILGLGTAFVTLASRQQQAEMRLSTAFRTMGAEAWTTTEALHAQARALQEVTTFGDEAILELQALLITFGELTNEVGEGNDIFDRATLAGLDLSTALGQDLKSSAQQLGRALNDPIRGITALRRVGVAFSREQEEQIRVLVESGRTMDAQKLILDELERQYGGMAQAMAQTDMGQMAQAMNRLRDAGEELGAVLLPVLGALARALSRLGEWFQSLDPRVKEWIVATLAIVAAVGPVIWIIGKLVAAFVTVGTAFKALSLLLLTNPFVALAAAVIGLVILIVTNWEAITQFLSDAWNRIVEIARNIASAIVDRWQALIDWFKALPGLIWDAIKGIGELLVAPFRWAADQIRGIWDGIVGAFSGRIGEVQQAASQAARQMARPFGIPTGHSGGMYLAPPGRMEGLAMLRHGEIITPPGQRAGTGEGSRTYQLIVQSLDPRAAATAVVEALQEWERVNGAVPVNVRS